MHLMYYTNTTTDEEWYMIQIICALKAKFSNRN